MNIPNNSGAKYFNALNILNKGSYSKIKGFWEKYKNWEKAWIEESASQKSGIDPEKEWEKLQELNIKLILKDDNEYPPLLKEIPLPPFGIYVIGNINYKQPALAIVGTRTATPKGKEIAKKFAEELSNAGIAIISGLALGIDAAAHLGALENNNKTIAVLGTPPNDIYPKQNAQIAEKIIKNNGAIISEFPIGHEYHPANFLIRNRIISGLAKAILIIEAPERSGSLATARFAIEQNREVLVIPGNINSANYIGSNKLIKEGAAAVTEIKDILDFYEIKQKNKITDDVQFCDEENKIISAIGKNGGEITMEKLLETAGGKIEQINKSLALLVIKGIIKELNNKYYIN